MYEIIHLKEINILGILNKLHLAFKIMSKMRHVKKLSEILLQLFYICRTITQL